MQNTAQQKIRPHCVRCGDILALLKSGDGAIACCEPGTKTLQAAPGDATQSDHAPVVTQKNGKTQVVIGNPAHPMKAGHYIQWVALMREGALRITFLNPGSPAAAEFEGLGHGTAYAYCSVHGLRKAEF